MSAVTQRRLSQIDEKNSNPSTLLVFVAFVVDRRQGTALAGTVAAALRKLAQDRAFLIDDFISQNQETRGGERHGIGRPAILALLAHVLGLMISSAQVAAEISSHRLALRFALMKSSAQSAKKCRK